VIVKKVATSKQVAPKSKALNVRALIDYIAGPTAGGDGEKVERRGALNLLNIDHDAQVQEMIDLAEIARRSPQPVQHWILSWREGEQPSPAQADEAVALFLDEMGLAGHQAIYALHRNTKNCHLHLAVNRVRPDTEKLVTVNNGFDHEVAHRAIARIEHRQGWQREDRALFVPRAGGDLERSQPRAARDRQPASRARDFEERVGELSAQRTAIEVAAPIIREARSWSEMHAALARENIRFERKGSGAILWIGQEAVKASSAGRECSMAALQKRLGEFAPVLAGPPAERLERVPQPIEPGLDFWGRYAQERSRHQGERTRDRKRVVDQQREQWTHLAERHRRERADMSRRSWKGQGALLNATRSVLAARQAQEKANLRDQQKLERAALRRERVRFPSFREWLSDTSPDLAQQWRHRERRPALIEGPTFEQPTPCDIRAFSPVVEGARVHYHLTGQRGAPAFTDRGRVIDIRDSDRRETVLAALQLSAQKWGTFTVHGSEHFRRLCVELAAEHGLKIANPDLHQAIAATRQRLRSAPEGSGHEPGVASSLAEAYCLHFAEVARQASGAKADWSRLDAEVAVRLRLTGHHRDAITRAIGEGARARRPHEKRDWQAYARRATNFAFGVPGARLADQLAPQREHLLRVEGRPLERVLESRLGGPLRFDR
jgi:Relaxase/Mobilisation nuclease domain/Large polyvalent protein-associated domain 7